MAEDYQLQNVYRYTRKSYKNNARRVINANDELNIDVNNANVETAQCSPRSDEVAVETGCNCDVDPEGDIANILHKKCKVITLAQQQLKSLLDRTDDLVCDNTRCCRSVYDFLWVCQEVLRGQHKCMCFVIMAAWMMFWIGALFGAASCGTRLGKLNSPLLKCLDKLFTSDVFTDTKVFHGII